jgi:flagellar biosynthesis regulator FlbT
VNDSHAQEFAARLTEAAAAFRSKGITKEIKEIKSVLAPEVAEAITALSEAIQLLQSRDLEKEQRLASIEGRLEAANAILRGAA